MTYIKDKTVYSICQTENIIGIKVVVSKIYEDNLSSISKLTSKKIPDLNGMPNRGKSISTLSIFLRYPIDFGLDGDPYFNVDCFDIFRRCSINGSRTSK